MSAIGSGKTTDDQAADSAGATAARLQLGRKLRALREAKGITVDQAHSYIERSRPWYWKLETGLGGIVIKPNVDIRLLCELFEADAETREGLVALAEITKVKGRFEPYAHVVPPRFDTYLGLEEVATTICTFQATLVPGLLQTPEYARAILQIPGADEDQRSPEEVEQRVDLRVARQELLARKGTRKPPRLEIAFSEAVLHGYVGSAGLMAGQLRHINTLGHLRNVAVRVLPFKAGLREAMIAGPFSLLEFATDPSMVYADGPIGGLWFREGKEVSQFERIFDQIWKASLDEPASRDLIAQSAKELLKDG